MPTKEERAKEARKHYGMAKGLFAAETAKAIETAVIYEDGDGRSLELPEPRFESTTVDVAWSSAARVLARAQGKVCILDPANFRTPGGNYLNGGWSPEEQLCAEGNLLPILEGLREPYYDANRHDVHGGLNSDRAVYLTDVVFTTSGAVEHYDILVCAPPNRRFALENNRSAAECDLDLANRVQAIMHIAAANNVDTLVLNAFGCGFFGNDDAQVAGLFKQWIDAHEGQFQAVMFAIPGGPALDVFREVFQVAQNQAEQQDADSATEDTAAGTADVDSDDYRDEEDEIDIPQTSEGRWVFD